MKTCGLIFVDLKKAIKRKNKNKNIFAPSLSSCSHLSHPFDFYAIFILFILLLLFHFSSSYYYYFCFLLFLPLSLDTWLNVSHSYKCTTCHVMCHPTPDTSKNMKFRLSRNLTKFDVLTKFRETNSTVKFVSSSEI